jgi:hypothetical protein
LYSVFINLRELEMGEIPSVTEHLQQASNFMITHRLQAVFLEDDLGDGRRYEGISFIGPEDEIGEVRFVDGRLVVEDTTEIERRLRVQGFVNEVIRPVQRAASIVYAEGSDLLDERFDSLPGMA